ncbi:MAG: hypothetical protein IT378_01105 [Sandaracinaceae bacterium]|nr:hypothetical protein [Sandaracinaceae bacterium]
MSLLHVYLLAALLPIACGGAPPRQLDPSAPDGGTGPVLVVERVAVYPYLGPSRVLVSVRVRAGTEALALRSEHFSLETLRGARAPALDVDAPLACPGTGVPPGQERACHFAFRIPAGETPSILRYNDTLQVVLAPCGAAHPRGLCAIGELCLEGACVAQCDGPAGGGACFFDEEVCSPGGCVLPCSTLAPEGYCPSGRCDSGTCVPW